MFWVALLSVAAVLTAGLMWWTRQATASHWAYRRRARLLSEAEQALLESLEEAAWPQARVFARVRVGDVLAVQPGLPITAYRRAQARLERQAFDFLVCGRSDGSIRCAVAAEGPARPTAARRRRERRLQALCRAAGVGLVRVPQSANHDVGALRVQLETAYQETRDAVVPSCPRCRAPMVLRRGGAARHRGAWRCSRYPRCRTVLPRP